MASPSPETSVRVRTQDGIDVHSALLRNTRKSGVKRLTILSPGFAQWQGSRSMRFVAERIAFLGDVLSIDNRGTGASSGRFTFGAQESYDLHALVNWAADRYEAVGILGFSLGSYTALRALREWPAQAPCPVSALWLVSVPTRLEDIVTSGGTLLNPLVLPFRTIGRRFPVRPENNMLFRWGWPFLPKPDLSEASPALPCPIHFLCGGQDTLVFPSLSRRVYEATKGTKTWTLIPRGHHAERIALEFPEQFFGWLREASA